MVTSYILTPMDVFNFICRYYKLNWTEIIKQTSFKGTTGSYYTQKNVFEMFKYIHSGQDFLAWGKGMAILKVAVKDIRLESLATDEEFDDAIELLQNYKVCSKQYELVREQDRIDWWNWLKDNIIVLTEDEKKDASIAEKCPRQMTVDVDRMVNEKNLFNVFRYKGSDIMDFNEVSRIYINNCFVMTDNVSRYIASLPDGKPDELRVYTFLNIENHIDNSYFILAFNVGSNWFLASDETYYANPYAKEAVARRGAVRFREKIFEYTVMPYEWLDQIEEWRKDSRTIGAQEVVDTEIYIREIKEWNVVQRVFLNLSIRELVKKISAMDKNGQLEKACFGSDYLRVDRMLAAQMGPEDTIGYWRGKGSVRGAMDDIIDSMIIDEPSSGALVKVTPEKVLDRLAVLANSLMTGERYDNMSRWAVLEGECAYLRGVLKEQTAYESKDKLQLFDMVNDNIANLYDDLFCAEKVYIYIYNPGWTYQEKTDSFCKNGHSHILSRLHCGEQKGIGFRILGGKEGEVCRHCSVSELKKNHTSVIKIGHYAALAWLTGQARIKLPSYYRNFMNDFYWPYIGNTLLDNVNPMHRLKDECSASHDHIYFNLNLCRRCRTKYTKNYRFNEAVIIIDGTTGKQMGILEKEDFKRKYTGNSQVLII